MTRWLRGFALGLVATAIGFACGSASRRPHTVIATAGADRADGLLAAASRRNIFYRQGGEGYGGDRYGGWYYGYGGWYYGGVYYGEYQGDYATALGRLDPGATYGGMLYGNYQFVVGDLGITAGPVPRPYVRGYDPITVVDGGAIEGRVTWPHPPRVADTLPVRGAGCSGRLANPSVITDRHGNLANAVVYLDGIASGRSGPTTYSYGYHAGGQLQIGGVLELRQCRFSPHVQLVAPIGSTLEIDNGDATPRTVRARRWTETSRDLIFTTELRQLGKRYPERMDRDGFIEVRSLEDGEVVNGWVVVAGHPYYAITDREGRFRIDEIPAGRYRLVVWHEPVITGIDAAGRPVLGPPITVERRVRVDKRRETRVSIGLPAGR